MVGEGFAVEIKCCPSLRFKSVPDENPDRLIEMVKFWSGKKISEIRKLIVAQKI